jgi:hypothetical protein
VPNSLLPLGEMQWDLGDVSFRIYYTAVYRLFDIVSLQGRPRCLVSQGLSSQRHVTRVCDQSFPSPRCLARHLPGFGKKLSPLYLVNIVSSHRLLIDSCKRFMLQAITVFFYTANSCNPQVVCNQVRGDFWFACGNNMK